jgi:CRP-like cAMP-binding protein
MARTNHLLDTFRSLPMFAGSSEEELERVDALADEVTISAGRVLVSQGEIGREFVVIVSGEARVERDGVEIARLGAGDHFGELSLLCDHPRNATVIAVTDLVAEVIARPAFQQLLEDSPRATLNLLRSTAHRLSELDDELAALRSH